MKNKVEIFDMSYEGSGVGKLDGKIVFVPKTLVGEVVEIDKLKETKSFIVGKVCAFENKSEDRFFAKCPYFEKCGGCDFQHCAREKELQIKKQMVSREFLKAGWNGKIEVVEGLQRFSYRNKLKLEYLQGKLGFFASKSNRIIDVENCEIAEKEINFALKKVREFLSVNRFNFLKSVYLKKVENEIGICFLFEKNAKNAFKNAKNLEVLTNFSVFCAEGEVLESNKTQIFNILGKEKFEKNFDGFVCEFDISAFNQINDEVAEKLYDFVAEKTKGERVVNAYSGQGLLTRLIAKDAKFVYGIEYQKSAHAAAEKLKNQMSDYKIENACGKVEDVLGEILLKDRIDMIVLDPARDGCAKNVLSEILKSDIEEIVYVSCNFSTQVRDIKVLQDQYKIESVQIFDMFPCTANVETVVLMKRKKV